MKLKDFEKKVYEDVMLCNDFSELKKSSQSKETFIEAFIDGGSSRNLNLDEKKLHE